MTYKCDKITYNVVDNPNLVVGYAEFIYQLRVFVSVPENNLYLPSVRDEVQLNIIKKFSDIGLTCRSWREASDIFVFMFDSKENAAKARLVIDVCE